jgi:hypothetical protein
MSDARGARGIPRRRAAPVLLATLAAASLLASCLVVPASGETVAAVSRYGDRVRLLPSGWGFSCLLLEQRQRVKSEGGVAVIAAELALKTGAGTTVSAVMRLRVTGSGMALAGLPPDRRMHGRVAPWLLGKAVLASVSYGVPVPNREGPALPEGAAKEQIEKLRALGYLSSPAKGPGTETPAGGSPAGRQADRVEGRRLNNLGVSLVEGPDPAAAVDAFRKAIKAHPTFEAPYRNLLIVTILRFHRWDEAETIVWQTADRNFPNSDGVVVQFALEAEKQAMVLLRAASWPRRGAATLRVRSSF